MEEVGKVTHYYGRVGVAIVELSDGLRVGDKIKIEGNKIEFDQTVGSMEIDRKPVDSAKAGDVVGLKVDQKIGEGATVYKLEEGD
jgi:putative protease